MSARVLSEEDLWWAAHDGNGHDHDGCYACEEELRRQLAQAEHNYKIACAEKRALERERDAYRASDDPIVAAQLQSARDTIGKQQCEIANEQTRSRNLIAQRD